MTNSNTNEDAAGTITPPTVHLMLQGKGGIGKSDRGVHATCVDTDPVYRTFSQYNALGAQETEGAAGRDVSQLGAQITRKNLNVQSTIRIPAGYKFNVRVNRDILFEEPYSPVQPVGSTVLSQDRENNPSNEWDGDGVMNARNCYRT